MALSNTKLDFEKLLERLYDPVQLRVFITALMVVVGYAAVYMPLDRRIEETTRKLNEDRKRQALACDIERLRAEV